MPPDYASPARPDDPEGWVTIRRFLPYLWPADNPSLRCRIAGAMVRSMP
jgi:ATP-binding cassette subfamily B protein